MGGEIHSTNEWLSSSEPRKNFIAKYDGNCIGLFGWRRRCLFLLIGILLVLVILNLALTLWMLKVMEFSANGLGPLKVLSGGIQLRGEALVLQNLIASKIRSRKGQPIQIESSKNITLEVRSPYGRLLSKLSLGDESVESLSSSLKISDSQGKILFSADKKEVLVGAESLHVTGEGGAVFHGSVQTPRVKADSGQDLRLESLTRSLDISGTFGVSIGASAGDITASSLGDLKLQSQTGTIKIEAPNIYITNLETVSLSNEKIPKAGETFQSVRSKLPPVPMPTIYQVCICEKGRLFLAPPDGDCTADNDVCR